MKTRFLMTILAFAAVCTSVFSYPVFTGDPAPTKIIVVRHAETGDGSGLSEKGERRAALLADLLRSTQVDGIYACTGAHTNGTLTPLAANKGIRLANYDPSDIRKSLYDIYVANAGKTIVICGDDKTVPEILNLLTGSTGYRKLGKKEYDKVYILTTRQLGKGDVQEVRYATDLI